MLCFSIALKGIKALISLHLIFSCLVSLFLCCLRVDESSMNSPVDVVTEHFPGLPLQLPTAAVVDDDIFVDYNIVAHCLSRCCCCYSCCCYAVAEPHQPSALSILNRTRPRISTARLPSLYMATMHFSSILHTNFGLAKGIGCRR